MADTPMAMPRYPGQSPSSPGGAGAGAPGLDEPTDAIETPKGGLGSLIAKLAWVLFALLSLVFFTLVKLPDDRIKGYIQGSIASVLATRGITITTGESELSYLLGIQYVMKNVTLNFPPPEPPAHIDEIRISPAFIPLFTGQLGASVSMKVGKGTLDLTGGMRGHYVSASVRANQFDIGKIALLRLLADISGSAVLTGRADIAASTDDLTSTSANIQLDMDKILINSQSVQGFMIPALSMSQGQIDVEIDHGKGQVHTLKLGKNESPTDDIKANINGDIMFGKTLQNSTCNLKAIFSLSQNLLKSFSLLDAILMQGKQSDGSYSYRLEGPLLSPNPVPVGATAGAH